jgi:hypothetical protein
MGLKIPQSQIIKGKYTIGKEYVVLSTHKEYQGYYYELNGKTFAGKEFNTNAPEIIKMTSSKFNSLFSNPSTALYAKVSGAKLNNQKAVPYNFNYNSNKRYFAYHTINKLIKEVNKDNFLSLISNPIYVVVSLSYIGGFIDAELDQAEKQIPGIRVFIDSSYPIPTVEDDGTIF